MRALIASAWKWSTLGHLQTLWILVLLTFLIVVFGGDILALLLQLLGFKECSFQRRTPSQEHLLETLSISLTSTPPFVGPLLNLFCVLYLHHTWWWYIPYVVYAFVDRRPFTGGYKSDLFRRLPFWSYSARYFPVTVLKHDDSIIYPPDRPYLFGYHPHGILGGGAVLTFASEATDFSRMFPGLDIYVGTLNILFYVPFLRDWILRQGFVSVNGDSISAVLAKGPGKGVAIVIGGAKEAGLTDPKVCELVLLQRKGFFRKGLQHGCRLVPVFCFGENKLYNVIPKEKGSVWKQFSSLVERTMGFAVPAFVGRGIWQHRLGLIPARYPLTPVFGIPVDCPCIPNPTDADIKKIQEEYCRNLKNLFDTMKDQKMLSCVLHEKRKRKP